MDLENLKLIREPEVLRKLMEFTVNDQRQEFKTYLMEVMGADEEMAESMVKKFFTDRNRRNWRKKLEKDGHTQNLRPVNQSEYINESTNAKPIIILIIIALAVLGYWLYTSGFFSN